MIPPESTEAVWVTFTVADSPDLFAVPSIGLKMPVTVRLHGTGQWSATCGGDDGPTWYAEADTRDGVIVALIGARLGLST